MFGISKVQIFSSKRAWLTKKTVQSLIILAICFYVILAVPVYTCVCFKQPCQPKLCTERECFSCIQNLSQNPCHLCPPYLPTMWYFLPFQVNISCATFKLFKTLLLLICVNVLQLMRKYVVFYLSILSFTSDRLSPMDQWHIHPLIQ